MTKYQLQEVAQAEHVNNAGDLTKLSRGELCDKIVEHRVASTHKVGVTCALSVVVDAQHPLTIEVEPHSLERTLIKIRFQVKGWSFDRLKNAQHRLTLSPLTLV